VSPVTREKTTPFSEVGAIPAVNCTSYLFGRKECALRGHCKHRDRDRPELCTTRGFLKDDSLAYRRNFEVHSPESRGTTAVAHA
jgi:hypothetical protein